MNLIEQLTQAVLAGQNYKIHTNSNMPEQTISVLKDPYSDDIIIACHPDREEELKEVLSKPPPPTP